MGNATELPPARPGSDERFKEMKIGLFYDQAKEHRHVFVTENNHEAFGKLLKEHAAQVGFEQADQLALADLQINALEGLVRAIALAQVVDGERIGHS